MKRFSASVRTAVAGLLLTSPGLFAQQPGHVAVPTLATQGPAAPTGTRSGTPAPGMSEGGHCPQTCKVCVSEPKQTTKKVYACKSEEYCLPRCSFLSLLLGKCGCDESCCGDVKIRHRLIVKKVEDRDTRQCVPREVPVGCPAQEAQPARQSQP